MKRIIRVVAIALLGFVVVVSGQRKTEALTFIPPVVPVLPSHVQLNVPYTSQAPYGNWRDPRQQDGCEEAALAMAMSWRNGLLLPQPKALSLILNSWAWEVKYMGAHPSLNANDTKRLAAKYFGLKVTVFEDVTLYDLKKNLAAGNLIIVPTNGRVLKNPKYTPPGPTEHMLVLTGYDDATKEFITNDPGIRRGQGYRYPYDILVGALREYPTGHREKITTVKKVMLIVTPPPQVKT